jgi:hypothetical protein
VTEQTVVSEEEELENGEEETKGEVTKLKLTKQESDVSLIALENID